MTKIAKIIPFLGSALLSLSAANAGSVPNNEKPTTFLGPTVKGRFTTLSTETAVLSLAGEVGLKNFRLSTTYGWRIAANQRIKFTGEYLWQNVSYPLFTNNSDQWVNQGAISAAYQYLIFDMVNDPAIEVSAFLSHANSNSLGGQSGLFNNNVNVPQIYLNQRRIAGSNAGGLELGGSLQPWVGSRFGVYLNYDNVRYNNKNSNGQSATGFGGTARLRQVLTENIQFEFIVAYRQPFNHFGGSIGWANVPSFKNWAFNFFGDYIAGKTQLPDSYNMGMSADYYFDSCTYSSKAKVKEDYKDEMPFLMPVKDDLIRWTADPGVYIPQVLAIPDQRVTLITPQAPTPLTTVP